MKREECKSLEDILTVSHEEHMMISEEKGKVELKMNIDIATEGHPAIALKDMMQAVALDKSGKEKNEAHTKLLHKIFEEGLEVVWMAYKKSVIEKMKDSADKVIVVKDKESAREVIDLLKEIIKNEPSKKGLLNRLEKFTQEDL